MWGGLLPGLVKSMKIKQKPGLQERHTINTKILSKKLKESKKYNTQLETIKKYAPYVWYQAISEPMEFNADKLAVQLTTSR